MKPFVNFQRYCGILPHVAKKLPNGSNKKNYGVYKNSNISHMKIMKGLCVNETVDHYDTRDHRNMIYLVLVWDFGQGVLMLNPRCYVIQAHTTHIG
jgi:hypothetical protein